MNDDPVALCRAGRISPEICCARLLLAGRSPDAVGAVIASEPGFAHLAGIDLGRLRRMIDEAAVVHPDATTPEAVASMFDRAITISPEASVALYSLGDKAALARATAALVDWLDAEGVLRPDIDVLDLGCGIGRVSLAIADRVRSVRGLDVSAAMVAEARRRAVEAGGAAAGVEFRWTNGRDLDGEATASRDLVLAVDSFPYLWSAGLVDAHVGGIGRVLRPGGHCVICNLRYGGDAAEDEAWRELVATAAAHGLAPTAAEAGARPFAARGVAARDVSTWDGRVFTLRRTR